MTEAFGDEAVAKRPAPMCVVHVSADPKKAGEQEPSSRVAEECGKLLMALPA